MILFYCSDKLFPFPAQPMAIFRATILDLSGQEILIPGVMVHVVEQQDRRLEAAFQVTESVATTLDSYGKYRIAFEDGRGGECLIEKIQSQPDGTVTCS